jgi:hypothetical protein
MQIGLKNAQEVVAQVGDLVQFAVNEECAASGDCSVYQAFLNAGKPVFHIEYPWGGGGDSPGNKTEGSGPAAKDNGCLEGFSTVLKYLSLDGYVEYCDGSTATTPTSGGSSRRSSGN